MRAPFAIARTVIIPGAIIILRTLLTIATGTTGRARSALAVALRRRALDITADFAAGVFRPGIPFRRVWLALTFELLAHLVAFAFLALAQLHQLALMTFAEFTELLLRTAAHLATTTFAAVTVALRRGTFAIAAQSGTQT